MIHLGIRRNLDQEEGFNLILLVKHIRISIFFKNEVNIHPDSVLIIRYPFRETAMSSQINRYLESSIIFSLLCYTRESAGSIH